MCSAQEYLIGTLEMPPFSEGLCMFVHGWWMLNIHRPFLAFTLALVGFCSNSSVVGEDKLTDAIDISS